MTNANVTENQYKVTVSEGVTTVVTAKAPGPQGADAVLQAGDRGDFTVSVANNGAQTAVINSGAINNDKVASDAAIAGAKISPNFGNQNINTSGNLNVNGGQIAVSGSTAALIFTDNEDNPDYRLTNNNGIFKIRDTTNSVDKIVINTDGHVDINSNLDCLNGLDVSGIITGTSHLDLPSNAHIKLGDNDEFFIFHQSSNGNSIIKEQGGGGLSIQSNGSFINLYDVNNNRFMASFNTGGSCQFRHGADIRLATSSTGIDVTGDISVSGTVDSVDLSTYQADGGSYLRSDADDSFTGTLTANSDGVNPIIKVQGFGPNFIRFASSAGGTVDSDSIDLIYRATPNTIGFERASDAQVMFSVDADTQQAIFNGNVDCNAGLDVSGGDITGTLGAGVTGTTQSASDNSTKIATTSYVDTAVSNLVDSAPNTLDTLNELAAALGDDANFSTTVTNSIADKLPLAGGTLSGQLTISSGGLDVTGDITLTGNISCNPLFGSSTLTNFDEVEADAGNFQAITSITIKSALHPIPIAFISDATFDYGVTVSGNLTVDTDTLFVDSTNDKVGINQATPDSALDVTGQIRSFSTTGTSASGLKVSSTNENVHLYLSNGNANANFNISYGGSGGADIVVTHDGAVKLFNGGGTVPKLATSATGVDVNGTVNITRSGGGIPGLKILDSGISSGAPYIEVIGRRDNSNNSPCFSGKVHLARYRDAVKVVNGNVLGVVAFGGNHTQGGLSNILYTASISGVASGDFDANDDMPTDLVFYTGSLGRTTSAANVTTGDERMRIKSDGTVDVEQNLNAKGGLDVTGKATVTESAAIGDTNLRKITTSTSAPTSSDGSVGDIWIVYPS